MFEKVPYGVKVRVRGNEQDGFIAEYAICTYRFFPFLDTWTVIKNYSDSTSTYSTLEHAKEVAMIKYHSWINFYERAEEEKRIAKSQRKVVWKHP
jgi:hypothetical protein